MSVSMGKGIAIAGIWAGVGISSLGAGGGAVVIAFCAFLATVAVLNADDGE